MRMINSYNEFRFKKWIKRTNELKISDLHKEAFGIRKQLRKKFDMPIVCTGRERIGKSTFVIGLGMEIDPVFKKMILNKQYKKALERNVVFSPTEQKIKDIIRHLPKRSAVILDEGMKTFDNKDWMTILSKKINKFFSMCGMENKAVLICIPYFPHLSKYWRAWRLQRWYHIVKRGYAIKFKKSKNPIKDDPWELRVNEGVIDKHLKKGEGVFKSIKETDIYKGVIVFPKLVDEFDSVYQSMAKQFKYGEEYIETKEVKPIKPNFYLIKYQNAVTKAVKKFKELNYSDRAISKLIGLGTSTINGHVHSLPEEEANISNFKENEKS